MPEYYDITITQHDDPEGEASFLIEPPVRFLSEEKRDELAGLVRKLVLNRMGVMEDNNLKLCITHDLPDGSGTVGRATFRGLNLATGAVVLQQALELGLNGTSKHVSPNSPLNQ